MKFAEILFQTKVSEDLDKQTLTYSMPDGMGIKAGQLVQVKLRNKPKTGLVWQIHEEKPNFRTMPIVEILQEEALLSAAQLKLVQWMSNYYFTPLHSLIKTFIPKRVFDNKPVKTRSKEKKVPEALPEKTLTTDQQAAFDEILNSSSRSFLLQGVTGSGKTEVYTKITKHFLAEEKQILILVPEISLTPQTVRYFEQSLQTKVAVFHSKRSEGEKYRDWMAVYSGEKKVVIGSRSALFAPWKNLAAIIVDEEHDGSYKQDSSPRYHAHKIIAEMQRFQPELKAIFGSATPSIATAHKLKESTLHLKERINKGEMPDVEIIDLRIEFEKRNKSIFSDRLQEEISKSLERNEQVILFLNRRGSASSVVCRDCGYAQICNKCDSKMTYHPRTFGQAKMICHHCGIIEKPLEICPSCSSKNIRFLGIGTQRVEDEVHALYPEAKVLRADRDTTSTKEGFEEIYQQFKEHKADVLVGTQMIAKGLHLPKVSLVGVVLADIGLNIGSFSNDERNFQLITQVAGRAGRAHTEGKVIIQTYNPEHIALTCTKQHDYDEFFNYEIKQRKLLHYPPFGSLINLLFEDENEARLLKNLDIIEEELWKQARLTEIARDLDINVFPSFVTRLRGKFRYNILIKSAVTSHNLHKIIRETMAAQPEIKFKVDPDFRG